MNSSLQTANDWVIRNKWWVALIVVVIFGYTIGKDMALRDNAADSTISGEVE